MARGYKAGGVNLEAIERVSGRIRRLRRIVETMQSEVEAAIERALGSTFFLASPTPKRFAARHLFDQLCVRESARAQRERRDDAPHVPGRAIKVKPLRGNCSATTPAAISRTPAVPKASQCVPKRS